MRKFSPLLLMIFLLFMKLMPSQAGDDGIPDNCEYTNAAYYRANLFPRYEPQNSRLLLVDWSTGADALVIATDLPNTLIRGWSADCRYLAVAVGSPESFDTVVFDTTGTNLRVGSVPDAHKAPHPITWGPGNYLVVETRNGAILWNVPANTQVTVTTSFDAYTGRNFSRLRWDAEHLQLTGNLAVGGREVYDLTTGQQVDLAPGTFPDEPYIQDIDGSIVIAGKKYACRTSGSGTFGNVEGHPQNIVAVHNAGPKAIYLVIHPMQSNGTSEVLQVIETEVDISWFEVAGWSANCRYFAARLGRVGENSSDTVVWDVLENRRVGAFEDARLIVHPLYWSPSGDALVVETRDGAYLWYLPTNKRTLINPNVETALAGRSIIRSFYRLQWSAAGYDLLTLEVGSPGIIKIYDVHSGQLKDSFDVPGVTTDVNLTVSADGRKLVAYDPTAARFGRLSPMTLINRDIQTTIQMSGYGYATSFSPDSQYLVETGEEVRVWDMQNLQADGTPNRTFEGKYNSFVDNQTIAYLDQRLNIVTGAVTVVDEQYRANLPETPVDGESGYGDATWHSAMYTKYCNYRTEYDQIERQVKLFDRKTGDFVRILAENVNEVTTWFAWSPDCRYVQVMVSMIDNSNSPYDSAPLDDTYRYRLGTQFTVWDTQTGEQIAAFAHSPDRDDEAGIWWSPDGKWALVRVESGHYVFNPDSRHLVLLTFHDATGRDVRTGAIYSYPHPYWDFAHGQVILQGWRAKYAFDLWTGGERASFPYRTDN